MPPRPKTNEQKIKDTMSEQKNSYNKLWLWLSANALSGMMDEVPNLSEAQKRDLINDPTVLLEHKPDTQFDPMTIEGDNQNKISKCKNLMFMMGVMKAKLAIDMGAEQIGEEESLINEEIDNKLLSEKAAYLVLNGNPAIMRMYDSFKSFYSNLKFSMDSGQTTAFLANPGEVTPDTTMDQLADKLELGRDDRAAFFKEYGANKDSKVLDTFKKRLKKQIDQEKAKAPEKRDERFIATNVNDQNEVLLCLIKSCNFYLTRVWEAKGEKIVTDSLSGLEKDMYEKGTLLQRGNQRWSGDTRTWINGRGNRLAEKKRVQNISKSAKPLIGALTGEKPTRIRASRGMTAVFPEEIFQIRTNFLSGVIAKFEATKQGTSFDRFFWHNKNSDAYETMLKSVKAFEKAAFEKKTGETAERREEMLKKCYEYINGKETKRVHDFGKERFNLAMLLIKEYDTPENFQNLCAKINRIRDTEDVREKDHVDAASVAKYERKYDLHELGKTRLYDATCVNSTFMSPDAKQQFAIMETVYTKDPKYAVSLAPGFTNQQFAKLKKIDKSFHQIKTGTIENNAQPEGKGLSDKDFAAIAYAASLSEKAAGKSEAGYPKNINSKDIPFLYSSRYTSDLMSKKELPSSTGKVTPVIVYGREKAVSAMKEYGKNNKKELANILANALVLITEKYRIKNGVDDELVADGEMAARMCNMLLRDEELLKAALASKTGFNMGNLRMVSSINTACELYQRATMAKEQISKAERSGKDDMSDEMKKQLMTDIVAYMKVKEWLQKRTTDLVNDTRFVNDKNVLTTRQNEDKKPTDKVRADLSKKYPNGLVNMNENDERIYEENRKKELAIDATYKGKEKLIQKKYVRNYLLVDQMKETGAIDAIRRESANLVEEKVRGALGPDGKLTVAKMKEIMTGISGHVKNEVNKAEPVHAAVPQGNVMHH